MDSVHLEWDLLSAETYETLSECEGRDPFKESKRYNATVGITDEIIPFKDEVTEDSLLFWEVDVPDVIPDELYFDSDLDVEIELSDDADDLDGEAELPVDLVPNVPAKPGLVFRVEKGRNTFCLRGKASSNMKESIRELLSSDEAFTSLFKMETVALSQLRYVETIDESVAAAAVPLFINRRFTYNEEMICNLSDPGFSWWLSLGDHALKIYFKNQGIDSSANLMRLGPMIDKRELTSRLNQFVPFLTKIFKLEEFSSDDKALVISTDKPCESFEIFSEIFTKGINNFDESLVADGFLDPDLYILCEELAFARRLWLVVEGETTSFKDIIF